jgi:hypothetical protein
MSQSKQTLRIGAASPPSAFSPEFMLLGYSKPACRKPKKLAPTQENTAVD